MRRRTDIDWSNHIVEAETAGNFATIHRLRVPGSICLMVEFVNMHDRGMLVRGDFGSWIFSRCFSPSDKGYASVHYWIEKLWIANPNQKAYEFSKPELDIDIKRLEECYNNDCLHNAEEVSEMDGFINNLRGCETERDLMFVIDDAPAFIEPEDYPNGLDICHRLKIIFDAFDEICARIKCTENETKNWR